MEKTALRAWYDAHIAAGWYQSLSMLLGVALGIGLNLPEILDFIVNHWDLTGARLLPTLDPSTKALLLTVYVTFIAPPLRAWRQKKMQAKALKQAAEQGAISTTVGTATLLVAVPGVDPVLVRADEQARVIG